MSNLYPYFLCLLLPFAAAFIFILFSMLFFRIKFRSDFKKRPKKQVSASSDYREPSLFYKIFILFPRSFIRDLSHKDPDEFPLY